MFCLEYYRNQMQAKKHDYTCPGRLLCMHRCLAGQEFLHFINEDGVIFCLILSLWSKQKSMTIPTLGGFSVCTDALLGWSSSTSSMKMVSSSASSCPSSKPSLKTGTTWSSAVVAVEADSSSILSMAIKASLSASASSNDADFWESSYSIPIRSPVQHTHTKHISTSVHTGFLVTLIHKMPWLSQDQTGLLHWKYLFGWIHVQFSLVTHYLLVKYF